MSDTETLPAVTVPRLPIRAGNEIRAIVPADHGEAFRMAQGICQAGLAPDSYKNDPHKVTVGIMAGMELGVPPLQALSGIAIINGRPAVWGDLAVGLCQSKGAIAKHQSFFEGEEGTDGYTAVYQIWRVGQPNCYEGRFSIGDAKRAKLWANPSKRPWIEYPNRMLFNRARAFALRDGFSDHLKGLAIAEEARDSPAPVVAAAVPADLLADESEVLEAPEPAPDILE